MTPALPPGANKVYTAPENWDAEKQGPCLDLHVIAEPYSITSIWLPTADELAQLNNGGYVMLVIAGTQMPPVIVTTCAV
jgi:hypothetical protein